ncbi:hypothetical protein BKI52_12205 [marine bacterium AO1-C]|nr:hypothetical protein BKI52_12205 [marine bacterium AO1-C]
MNILLDENYARVQVDGEHRIVEIIWKKFAMSKQYRDAIEVAYEAVTKYDLTGWLSDMTQAGVVAMQDQNWVIEDIVPKCIAAGIAKTAVVDSKDIFSKKYVESIEAAYPNATAEHFKDITSARKWLKQESVLK